MRTIHIKLMIMSFLFVLVSGSLYGLEQSKKSRLFIGAGFGYGNISKKETYYNKGGASANGRIGLGHPKKFLLMLEYESHILNEEDIEPSEFTGGPGGSYDYLFRTKYIFTSMKIFFFKSIYVKPSIGFGIDYFASVEFDTSFQVIAVNAIQKRRFAAGASLGYELMVLNHMSISVEGFLRDFITNSSKTAYGFYLGVTFYL